MRLVLVELRKATDTRAARWLLAVVGLLTVAAPAAQAAAGPPGPEELAVTAELPSTVLLPVLAVLCVTSEWSQRTALTTFTLVPGRLRVMTAKLAAVTTLALAAVALAETTAAVLGPGPVPAAVAAQLAVVGIATMWCGFGFGLLLLASAPAIGAYYVVPIAWSALGRLVPPLSPAAGWLDMSRTQVPLTSPGMAASEWARFAVSAVVWVVAPITLGLMRTNRAEIG